MLIWYIYDKDEMTYTNWCPSGVEVTVEFMIQVQLYTACEL
jgi:hypothetical protein